jgi:Mg-chelatase subunit ChlD
MYNVYHQKSKKSIVIVRSFKSNQISQISQIKMPNHQQKKQKKQHTFPCVKCGAGPFQKKHQLQTHLKVSPQCRVKFDPNNQVIVGQKKQKHQHQKHQHQRQQGKKKDKQGKPKVESTSFVVKKLAKKETVGLFVNFLLDSSGSMHGERLNGAFQGLEDACNALDKKKDLVCLNDFNTTMHCCFTPRKPSQVKMNVVRQNVQANGATSLFDSILGAMKFFKKGCKRDPFLIVFTDGHDNSSSHGRDDVVQAFQSCALKQFRVILIGSGLHKSSSGWNDLKHIQSHCPDRVELWSCRNTGGEIREILRRTVKHIQMFLIQKKTIITKRRLPNKIQK